MRRRRRGTPDYKLQYQGGNEVKSMLSSRCDFRLALRLPFTFDRRAMFEHLIQTKYGEDVLSAIKTIEQNAFAKNFNENDDFLLRHGKIELRIDIPNATFAAHRVFYSEPKYSVADLPDSTRLGVKRWIADRVAMEEENKKFLYCVDSLFEAAGTWGQVVRIWPDIRNLLAECDAAKRFFEAQKVKSRLPSSFDASVCNWDREFMNTLLAELLFIGEPDGREKEGLSFTTYA